MVNKTDLDNLKNHFSGLIQGLSSQIVDLTTKVDAQNKIMADQKTALDAQDKTIKQLKNSLNDREQYTRNYSVRIFNHALPTETNETDVNQVLKNVYETLLVPILTLAVGDGTITSIPSQETLLEYGHILGKGKNGVPPAIIIKFYSRFYRSVLFRYKRAYLNPYTSRRAMGPQGSPASPSDQSTPPPTTASPTYINEDLTTATYIKLKEMIKDRDIKKVWTMNGKIRYLTHEENDVKLLKNIF
jgi:hypothetical protein